MMSMMSGGMGFWLFLLVVLILGVFVWMLTQQTQASANPDEKRKGMTKSAREIADERLATGDISSEEHQQIRERIQSNQ